MKATKSGLRCPNCAAMLVHGYTTTRDTLKGDPMYFCMRQGMFCFKVHKLGGENWSK